jgi:two-component system chemotaxis sensor kinase CheA
MENYTEKFKEEAIDFINELEEALLVLEFNPENKEQIALIFRVMHSLKGAGAMFGYDKISDFTHNLETLYDFIKTDRLPITKNIFDLTLQSVDILHALLENQELDNPVLINLYNKITKEIEEIIASVDNNWNNRTKIQQINFNKTELEHYSTYFITFIPDKNILKNGTNPLYLIDELSSMGKTAIFIHYENIPDLKMYEPSSCYVWWELLLATNQSAEDVRNVFIFVEDDCRLEINVISDTNLLDDSEFVSSFKNQKKEVKITDIEQIKTYIENYHNEKEEKNKKLNQKLIKDTGINSIRVSTHKLDEMLKIVSELITVQSKLTTFSDNLKNSELSAISESVTKITKQLRDNAYKISLIPVNTLTIRFQRLVRDLSVELGKEAVFESIGGETELDKKIVELITDPILHIIRNSLDHGIESKEERIKKGKSPRGKIRLKAYYNGANVIIQIKDDGKGIDTEFIRKKAIEKGFVKPEVILGKRDILNFLFLPGFSTADKVTEVSGRGVGMDVVRKNINEIRGEIEIDSVVDKGTTITLKLPLTLSIVDGLLVLVDKTTFLVPLTAIHKIYAIKHQLIENNYYQLLVLDGNQIPYIYLRNNFGMDSTEKNDTEFVLVIQYENRKVGLIVDKVLGEFQAVVKPLGKLFNFQESISGATILGDGNLALVIDTNKTIQKFSSVI